MSAAYPPNVLTRDDSFFGVCQAIGDDFGFDPTWLRVAFSVPVIWSPTGVVIAYVALGTVVLLSRLLFPVPRRKKAAKPAQTALPEAGNDVAGSVADVLAAAA
jgi:phage shock protein PspC (stress-responsive transcriptional regulator)